MSNQFQLLAAKNLTEQAVAWVKPWEFDVVNPISEKVRTDKKARNAWYRNSTTVHQFYSGYEGLNPNARITTEDKGNPIHIIHAFVADYDFALSRPEILAGVERMGNRKPTWLETSLGYKFRLVWFLEKPLLIGDELLAREFLKAVQSWLPLDKLPELDLPAWNDPSRLYANGAVWECLDNAPLSHAECKGLLMETARKTRWDKKRNQIAIPLAEAEKLCRERYPNFHWPGEFKLESQGPSFWVEGSASPMSAIVKEEGILTFAQHAIKPFYSWKDILGREAVERYQRTIIGDATDDMWYDGEDFYGRALDGSYVKFKPADLQQDILVAEKGLSWSKAEGEPLSPVQQAVTFIRRHQRVECAGPFVHRPPGLITHNGKRILNTWSGKLVLPVDRKVLWTTKEMPLLAHWLPVLLKDQDQFDWTMSWLNWAYKHALLNTPVPGQALFIMGQQGKGKTLFARQVVGVLFGGFIDAENYFLGLDPFNAHLFDAALWSLDDTITACEAVRRRFLVMLKKMVANAEHLSNKKFHQAALIEWLGRVMVTLNCDPLSARTLLPTESGLVDKVAYLRGGDDQYVFPSREEITRALAIELPRFARFVLDWEIPARWAGDTRYGVKSYFDQPMHDGANHSGEAAPWFELLTDFLKSYFRDHDEAAEWRGNVTSLLKAMYNADPGNQELIRAYRPEVANRCMASVQASDRLKGMNSKTEKDIRVWIFPRPCIQPEVREPFKVMAGEPF